MKEKSACQVGIPEFILPGYWYGYKHPFLHQSNGRDLYANRTVPSEQVTTTWFHNSDVTVHSRLTQTTIIYILFAHYYVLKLVLLKYERDSVLSQGNPPYHFTIRRK
jgi:hypothetical protein